MHKEHRAEEDFFSRSIKAYYDSPDVPGVYATRSHLLEAERFILTYLADELRGRSLLDIGVGPGRTIPFFRAACGRYTGIDYSANMLLPGRAVHPDVNLLLCDARSLCFPAASFDAVFFCNAIDDVGHEDRLHILREAHRVLRAPGIFVFSVHNLATERQSPWALPRLSRRPGESVRALRKYLAGIVRHLRLRRHQQRGQGFAVASDGYFDYGLLTYYVAREEQRKQLAETGFSHLQEVGSDGSLLAPGAPCRDAWIFYIARKAE
jgi:ubiquinone/menaquinone biosynthesis C-methylase UbiE